MAVKLKITSRSAGTIRHVGATARSVSPELVAKALGAAEVLSRENARAAPISLHALRRELANRVRSNGGRPALEGATKIQKYGAPATRRRRTSGAAISFVPTLGEIKLASPWWTSRERTSCTTAPGS